MDVVVEDGNIGCRLVDRSGSCILAPKKALQFQQYAVSNIDYQPFTKAFDFVPVFLWKISRRVEVEVGILSLDIEVPFHSKRI